MDKRVSKIYRQSTVRAEISEGISAVELIMSMLFLITLTAEGEVYKLIREQFEEDEKILNEMIGIEVLGVDEAADVITGYLKGQRLMSSR